MSEKKLFSNRELFWLFLPLVIEQLLEFMDGLADSLMAASIGEAAVSGISLVDQVMALIISLFAALATGGAVVAGQYLGGDKGVEAKKTANQLIWIAGISGVCIMALVYLLRGVILRGLFGQSISQLLLKKGIVLQP